MKKTIFNKNMDPQNYIRKVRNIQFKHCTKCHIIYDTTPGTRFTRHSVTTRFNKKAIETKEVVKFKQNNFIKVFFLFDQTRSHTQCNIFMKTSYNQLLTVNMAISLQIIQLAVCKDEESPLSIYKSERVQISGEKSFSLMKPKV